MYQPFSEVSDLSTAYHDLLLLTKPSQSCLLPSVTTELPQKDGWKTQDGRMPKIFCIGCCPESSRDLYSTKKNDIIRCHGIAIDARVTSQ